MPIPKDPEGRREFFRQIGIKGGKSRSPAKVAAVRRNARKAGRYCLAGTIRSIDDPPVHGVKPRKPTP